MMTQAIYLDYAATTPVDPRVAEVMGQCLTLDGNFGNPASRSHFYGWKAEESIELARRQLAELICADTREIVWTSGATESNNLALKGVLTFKDGVRPHIIVSSIEHKSVLDTADFLSEHGVDVSYVSPTANGHIELSAIQALTNDRTQLVSIMHVNNETGVINPVSNIGGWCREQGVLFHVDAAQSFGKLPIDVYAFNIDLLSISGHKIYGPKGVGALFVRRAPEINVAAQIHGGGHERGMRSGTLATHQIVGLAKAAEIATIEMQEQHEKSLRLAEMFWQGVSKINCVRLNGCQENRLPTTFNLAFEGIDGELLQLNMRDLAVSSGSACMSATMAPSYVLKEMGLSDSLAQSSLRFSFGRFTSMNDIALVIERIQSAIKVLKPGIAV